MRSLRILIWHVHGSYLYYLTKYSRHHFYVPFKAARAGDYRGKGGHIPWSEHVHDIPAEEVKHLELDCIIFQNNLQFAVEQYEILSPEQQKLPKIYLEHEPPLGHPTNTIHPLDEPSVLLVHVTPFNRLMWDSQKTPSTVIEYGVEEPLDICYTGTLEKGIVSSRDMKQRGRPFGFDIYQQVLSEIPLDLIGVGSLNVPGGIGEIYYQNRIEFLSRYRFFFSPSRYSSMGLTICEAMMAGMPVVGLATTEMATVIQNGITGYADTDVTKLILFMKELLRQPALAHELGRAAKRYAKNRFGLKRFYDEWDKTLSLVTGIPRDIPGEVSETSRSIQALS